MTDRFDAQLRQHLLGTADERPAQDQLMLILHHVAVTKQRRPLVASRPGFPVRIGPFPAAVRFGLIAVALVLAAMAGAILAGGSPGPPSTLFEGTWTSIDPLDGSRQWLFVGPGDTPEVRYEDELSTGGACINDEVKHFTGVGSGVITGPRLDVSFPDGGGCGLVAVSIPVLSFVHDPGTDTLVDSVVNSPSNDPGVVAGHMSAVWSRVRGDGPPSTVPPGPSLSPDRWFEGRWTATDPGDGSTLTLVVGEGTAPTVQFQDDLATGGVCDADEVKIFRADGAGEITGNRLIAVYPDGGGCGLMFVPIGGVYHYDADADALTDQDDVTWSRVPVGGDPPPTLRPAPSPTPRPTNVGRCIDLAQGGTYTAPDGGLSVPTVSLTATVPSRPVVPWQGLRDRFNLSSSCEDPAAMSFFAMTATSVNDGGCMPSSAEITDFADAIARLDSPKGNDISDRIDLTIDGHPAARYDISNLSTCSGFGLWSGTILGTGETGSVYVIDVDGVLLAIELNRDGTQTQAELEEAWAIIAALQIDR
jgi:hypothetical protein